MTVNNNSQNKENIYDYLSKYNKNIGKIQHSWKNT